MTTDNLDLSAKVAIVTGSGQGLGLAFAQALAKAGAAVVVNDRNAGLTEAAVKSIQQEGGRAIGVPVAVGSAAAADQLVSAAVDTFGRLDVMCTNAGILRDKTLWNMSDDDFDLVIETHLRGTFTCARAAVRQMRSSGTRGRIVLVSSIAGQRGNFGQGNYAAAKAGIAAMARSWALECQRAGITVNALVPAAMTQMVASIPGMEQYAASAARGEALPTSLRAGWGLGLPADVAPLLIYLASDQASHITGQCIGLGGDRLSLWSHPQEIKSAFRPGGWNAQQIAEIWPHSIGSEMQSFGVPLPGGK